MRVRELYFKVYEGRRAVFQGKRDEVDYIPRAIYEVSIFRSINSVPRITGMHSRKSRAFKRAL